MLNFSKKNPGTDPTYLGTVRWSEPDYSLYGDNDMIIYWTVIPGRKGRHAPTR